MLFKNKKTIRLNPQFLHTNTQTTVPDDFLKKCPSCKKNIIQGQMGKAHTCPYCNAHHPFPARDRVAWILDDQSFCEWAQDTSLEDPLKFPGYYEKLLLLQEQTGLKEAIIIGQGYINQKPVAIGVMDANFLMASMGTVVGEKLTILFEKALEERLPVIIYIASGGARMQEGILSLMQMAKVSQAVNLHHQAGLFYCAFLTHPTTGGVTASFAMQADIILAEPQAIIGFAGKRVIEQTLKAKLSDDFQKAEKVLAYGFVDHIVERQNQKATLAFLLDAHALGSDK